MNILWVIVQFIVDDWQALAAWMVMQSIADVCTWSGRGVTAADGSLDMFPMS
jgi:hypothetical protein